MRLEGKTALITGGSGGIGRATAIRFALEGARVAVVDMDEIGGQKTVANIGENGGDAVFLRADVTNPKDVKEMISTTVKRFGALHILFSNAGVGPTDITPGIESATEEDWHRILGINLDGVFLCAKYAVPDIKNSGGGCIINTASIAGVVALGRGGGHAYSTSKAAVSHLTKTLAMELARDKVRVNAVAPGFIDTPLTRGERRGQTPEEGARNIASYGKRTPIGRVGQPDDIANAVLFLASEEASFITGHTLVVDGGYTVE